MASVVEDKVLTATAGRAQPATKPVETGIRLTSIDALRGLVMILMLLDHVR